MVENLEEILLFKALKKTREFWFQPDRSFAIDNKPNLARDSGRSPKCQLPFPIARWLVSVPLARAGRVIPVPLFARCLIQIPDRGLAVPIPRWRVGWSLFPFRKLPRWSAGAWRPPRKVARSWRIAVGECE